MASQLFSQFQLGPIDLSNRIVVSPMCQYIADQGKANDWHLMHYGNLSIGAGALLIFEATHVSSQGRITHECLGLYDEETENVWKWVTGPEAGLIFWNGLANGSTPNFAFWNTGEPNNFGNSNEDYVHITAPNVGIVGSWNDLTVTGDASGDFQPKGYIVEYGGMPGDPVLNISASTSIYIPQIVSTSNEDTCPGGTVTLTATANEGTVFWYDSSTGGTLLGSGNTFTTPALNTSTTYFAAASPEGCPSINRVPVTAIINPLPVVTNPVLLAFLLREFAQD